MPSGIMTTNASKNLRVCTTWRNDHDLIPCECGACLVCECMVWVSASASAIVRELASVSVIQLKSMDARDVWMNRLPQEVAKAARKQSQYTDSRVKYSHTAGWCKSDMAHSAVNSKNTRSRP